MSYEEQTAEYTTGARELTPENVIKFTEAFLVNNQIEPSHVMIDKVVINSLGDEDHHVAIHAAFTGYLIGVGGKTVKSLAAGLCSFFGKQLKLEIKH